MRLVRIPEPFDHRELLFEPKIDGFRALAYVSQGACELVSRNGYGFKSWPDLCRGIVRDVRAVNAVIDGEICCLGRMAGAIFGRCCFAGNPGVSTRLICCTSTFSICEIPPYWSESKF